MEFYFPETFGEQLAFCSAAFTALAGLVIMFAPGYAMQLFGLQRVRATGWFRRATLRRRFLSRIWTGGDHAGAGFHLHGAWGGICDGGFRPDRFAPFR
ncbi:hypothetical protein AJ87_17245 [Rhizobium yanglingense]|nr:hypothetical protein AJ87_17245 [Rhizobium yanglingense]